MNILSLLQDRFRSALSELTDAPEPLLEMIAPTQDPKHGDYQANCAMSLGKTLGKPPREVAQQVVDALEVADICAAPEIAGPGFINLRLRDTWLLEQLETIRHDTRLGVSPADHPRTFVVDYSSPNVAKPMHVGHIRSTVIGDALCRTLRFLGHQVTSDNHLGDWGTQFGMIIYGYRHFADQRAYQENPVAELGRVYRQVRRWMDYHEGQAKRPQLCEKVRELEAATTQAEMESSSGDKAKDKKAAKALRRMQSQCQQAREELKALDDQLASVDTDPQLAKLAADHRDIGAAVLRETAKLHAGDAENRRLWEEFLPRCRQEIEHIYRRLGVAFDQELGESFYHERLAGVVDDFLRRGLARESVGAICVFLDGYDAPMIVRKQDGAFLYATSDLATIQYRMQTWKPDAILYVVDFRQGEHFGKLFAAARRWGYGDVELAHVSFGTVLGEDGKPFKTRAGDTVGLEELLDEAVRRAHKVVSENDDAKPNGPELSAAQRQHIADVIGHAAIKYADLAQNRTSDYVFSFDKMVAMQGNTATYMQYSYARIQAIFAKGNVDVEKLRESTSAIALSDPRERGLAIQLLQFEESLEEMIADYRPNLLTNYLYQLAKRFAEFYEACPVLKADATQIRDSRLLLCDLVARTLRQGLSLLGIQVVDKM